MPRRNSPYSVIAAVSLTSLTLLAPGFANGDCTLSVSPSALKDPARVVGASVLVPNTTPSPLRPLNLTPFGINFADCAAATVLRFQPTVTFSSADCNAYDVQVWASNLGANACVSSEARGASGSTPTCWLVDTVRNGSALNLAPDATGATQDEVPTWDIPVQTIVASQGGAIPAAGTVPAAGISACFTQPSASSVSFSILFLPVHAGTTTPDLSAPGYEYLLPVDLVGPPTPANVAFQAGDGALTLSWTANTDSDTYGYDVFIDPPASGGGASPILPVPQTSTCSSSGSGASGASGASSGEATDDGSTEASADASSTVEPSADATLLEAATDASAAEAGAANADGSSDAECFMVSASDFWSLGNQSACGSNNLTQGYVLGASASSSSSSGSSSGATSGASSGTSGSLNEPVGGGIAGIACAYLVTGSCSAPSSPAYTSQAITVTGASSSSYTATGLTNGHKYNLVVSAVDAFGNPGPPATEQCGLPAAISDFYGAYRAAGGKAGGGYCAVGPASRMARPWLSVGVAIGAGLWSARRRRRRTS
jgi:hypothetical protein